MLTQFTFYPLFGLPLIIWGGMFTFLIFALVAYIGWQNSKGVNKPPLITFQAHKIIALIALILALFHGLLGILSFIK
jgi:hypothetical protein